MFSFIVINFKTKEITAVCLDSIIKNCPRGEFEIILVDNYSSDGSLEYLRDKFGASVNLIAAGGNLGFGKANNLGAKAAKGDYLFFLNSDTILKENILSAMAESFASDASVGFVGSKLMLPDGRQQRRAYGRFPDCFNFIQAKFEPSVDKIQWVSGAALAIRKDVFEKIGGFDENFFMYFEDVDLCFMAAELGFKTVLSPASITHLGGQSPLLDKSRKIFYYQSQDYFFRKHYGLTGLCFMRFLRFFYLQIKKLNRA
jgi:hypothetical protein